MFFPPAYFISDFSLTFEKCNKNQYGLPQQNYGLILKYKQQKNWLKCANVCVYKYEHV